MASNASLTALANAAASDVGISTPGGFRITELAPHILGTNNMMNQYLSALVNRINSVIIHHKMFNNKFNKFKLGTQPYGSTAQRLYTNPAEPENYDMTAPNPFQVKTPDVKAAYFMQNSQKQFTTSVYRMIFKQAFTSEEAFGEMVNDIINQLYSGRNIYEFNRTKKMLSDSVNSIEVPTSKVINFGTLSKSNYADFVAECRATSLNMQFPSDNYNNWAAWAKYKNEHDTNLTDNKLNETPATTWTELEDQCMIIRADVLAHIDVEVLAAAFNMDKATFLGQLYTVDNFGETAKDEKKLNAILCDKSYIHIGEQGEEFTEAENGKALVWNYFLTTFQTYGTVPFANSVAFVEDNPIYDPDSLTRTA